MRQGMRANNQFRTILQKNKFIEDYSEILASLKFLKILIVGYNMSSHFDLSLVNKYVKELDSLMVKRDICLPSQSDVDNQSSVYLKN